MVKGQDGVSVWKEIQDCLGLRLAEARLTVFTQLTGVGLELVWHDPLGAPDRVSTGNGEKTEIRKPSSHYHWDIGLESSKITSLSTRLDGINKAISCNGRKTVDVKPI